MEEVGTWAYVPLVALVVIALITIVPFQRGEMEAKKQIDQLKNNGCKSAPDKKEHVRCITLSEISGNSNTVLFSGMLVKANSSHVALFDGNTVEIFPLTERFKLSMMP